MSTFYIKKFKPWTNFTGGETHDTKRGQLSSFSSFFLGKEAFLQAKGGLSPFFLSYVDQTYLKKNDIYIYIYIYICMFEPRCFNTMKIRYILDLSKG